MVASLSMVGSSTGKLQPNGVDFGPEGFHFPVLGGIAFEKAGQLDLLVRQL